MKYLKRFATETAYNEYINSGSTVYLPNVSLIDNGTVSKFNDSKWNQLVNGAQAEQQVSTFTYYQAGVTFPVGTKVFLSCDCKVTSDFSATSSPRLILSDNGSMYGGALNTMTGIAKDNQWHHYSGVVSSAAAASNSHSAGSTRPASP